MPVCPNDSPDYFRIGYVPNVRSSKRQTRLRAFVGWPTSDAADAMRANSTVSIRAERELQLGGNDHILWLQTQTGRVLNRQWFVNKSRLYSWVQREPACRSPTIFILSKSSVFGPCLVDSRSGCFVYYPLH